MRKIGPNSEAEKAELIDGIGVLLWVEENIKKPDFAPSLAQMEEIANAGKVIFGYEPKYIAGLIAEVKK